jgi:hypothetical protein
MLEGVRVNKKPALLPLILTALFVLLFIIWGMTAVMVDDELWFLPVFSADAVSIDLYWDGEQVSLKPGSEGYALLNKALQEELAHVRSYPNTAGLSEETLASLRAEGRLVESYYAEPVRIHSWYAFGPSEVFYIPVSGHHAAQNRVFNGARGAPLEMRSLNGVQAAAEAVARQEGLGQP